MSSSDANTSKDRTAGKFRPFVVNVASFLHAPGERRHVRRAGPLEGLAVSTAAVPEGEEVTVDVRLEPVESGILASGTVRAPWRSECSRCLRPVEGEAVAEVRELFEEGAAPDAEDAYPLDGERIDLALLAREAVLVELPQAPLCREDCLGICPTCGEDRNDGACPGHDVVVDPRWAALDQLRTN